MASGAETGSSGVGGGDFPFFRYQKVYDRVDRFSVSDPGVKASLAKVKSWVVQEKIHGTNFSIYSRGKGGKGGKVGKGGVQMLRYAKRSGFLDFESDWFFNFQKLDDHFHAEAKALHANIKTKYPHLDFIVVYGELFGGFYPHDAAETLWDAEVLQRIDVSGVCRVPMDTRAVQEGVYYSQDLDYMVFDVGCVMMDGEFVFLPFEEMQALVKQTKFLVTQALAIVDHFPSDYNVNFTSNLASQINSHASSTNVAEGVVIRPLEEIVLEPASTNQAPIRCLVKLKNAKFSEELENLQDGSADGSSLDKLKKSYKFCFAKLINNNRLQAVLSKDVGIATPENSDIVSQALADDAWDTFYEKFAATVQVESWDAAQLYVLEECRKLVKKHIH